MVAISSNFGPPTPTPPTRGGPTTPPITTPEALLLALTTSNFDLPALAAAIPPALLLQFAKDPKVLAELHSIANFSSLCQQLSQARFRSLAMTALADVIETAEDPTERRQAAAALLRATNPASKPAKSAAQADPEEDTDDEIEPDPEEELEPDPQDEDESEDEAEANTEASRPSRPTCSPSPSLTVQHVINKLLEAAERRHTPHQNSGLATLAAFCDDDAPLNDEPLPTDDPAACIAALADSDLSKVEAGHHRSAPEALTVSGQEATCTVVWSPAPDLPGTKLRLLLHRKPISRHPDAWLITSMWITPAPTRHDGAGPHPS